MGVAQKVGAYTLESTCDQSCLLPLVWASAETFDAPPATLAPPTGCDDSPHDPLSQTLPAEDGLPTAFGNTEWARAQVEAARPLRRITCTPRRRTAWPGCGAWSLCICVGPAKVQTGLATVQLGLELESEGNRTGRPTSSPGSPESPRRIESPPARQLKRGKGGRIPSVRSHRCPAPQRLGSMETVPQGLGPECIMTATPGSVNVSDLWKVLGRPGSCSRGSCRPKTTHVRVPANSAHRAPASCKTHLPPQAPGPSFLRRVGLRPRPRYLPCALLLARLDVSSLSLASIAGTHARSLAEAT